MDVFVDRPAKKICWNTRESFGEICVNCGCCSENAETALKSKIATLNDYIAEDESDIAELDKAISNAKEQKQRILKDIKCCKEQKRNYRKQLTELKKNV